MNKVTKANANPTKGYFVSMITRDITLEDCILDLIDNSVDSAWRSEGSRPMSLGDGTDLSAYEISILASTEQFSIKDNCGGMTLDDAKEHAFSFGRPVSEQHDEYSIGVYGIGMKRAAFKLGRNIRVRSTCQDNDEDKHSFVVSIEVDEWLMNDVLPWDFDIVEGTDLDQNGVEILVDQLTAATKSAFDNPAFLQNLRRTIARDYSIHLNRGLKIFVNNSQVQGLMIKLSQSAAYEPARFNYEEIVNGENVVVEIIGGMAARPPDGIDPADNEDGDKKFGWYVGCNGRIVLAADKTSVTGWGTPDWPQWHRQYSGFIGIILFTAANAIALPLTTTKRSVDISSEIYKRARPKMREISKAWIAYTNRRKQVLEEAKKKEATENITPIPIHEVKQSPKMTLPNLTIVLKPEPQANVNYSVPITRMSELASQLGNLNMSYRDVGIKSFDYAYDDLVGEE